MAHWRTVLEVVLKVLKFLVTIIPYILNALGLRPKRTS